MADDDCYDITQKVDFSPLEKLADDREKVELLKWLNVIDRKCEEIEGRIERVLGKEEGI